MNLRQLMTERILFGFTEEELAAVHNITTEEIPELSDLDFLELFEEAFILQG